MGFGPQLHVSLITINTFSNPILLEQLRKVTVLQISEYIKSRSESTSLLTGDPQLPVDDPDVPLH